MTLVDGEFVVGSPKNGKGRTVSLPAFVTHLLIAGEPTRWCSLSSSTTYRPQWRHRIAVRAHILPTISS